MVAANQPVGKPGAEQGHEVIGELEKMNDLCGIVLLQPQASGGDGIGDIASENANDAIIAETFAGLVADDELDLRRPAADGR